MKTISAIIKMSRPINCFITFITVVVACFICGGTLNDLWLIFVGGIIGLLVTASGNLINDYYDIEADRINRPSRVLPSEIVSPTTAVLFSLVFNFAALILSLFLGLWLFVITFVTVALLFLYSYKLKNIPLVSNAVIAFLTGLAFIFGSIIVGNVLCGIIPALFAFMINFMRELVKDIEDIDGDRAVGSSTYPIKYGVVNSVNIITVSGVTLILLTTIPFLFNIYNVKYFIIVMPFVNGILVFVISRLRRDPSRYNLNLSSSLLKLDMIIGIIAIVLGSNF
ncbi:Similar to (S)-2,3-di-O-geranylgeranylglyceryl phosphate synthase [hydrothermal vent metagenome]|uniref:Similar to (S)-2,3-di-O-geranylgeranylglyceryl phosphate synthase n=1 Tax=hydrothermal vent metagenome TaxID=652676 RepID=A0A3B1C2B1_9ZZZZ